MSLIQLTDLSVDYPIPHLQNRSLIGAMRNMTVGGAITDGPNPFVRAVNGITLTLNDGDRLGILGGNGAGKTTLLKAMAGILPPTEGRVRVEGRISPLISLFLGLDGESTGYENIRIRGNLMGFTEDQIEEKILSIAEFTELGDYLHLPLKTYSSGMRMRLTFAASTSFDPDVLLLDEWLGTGDADFRDKAAKRLRTLIDDAGIFVFASHARALHQQISNKGAVLNRGQLVFFGDINDAFEAQDEIFAKRKEQAKAE